MKTENDLPTTETLPEEPAGLFTDVSQDDGGAAMLPDDEFDGAAPSAAPSPEAVESKSGEKLLRLKMPNGNVFTGKDQAELLEKIYNAKIAADAALLDRENQIRTLKTAPAPVPAATNGTVQQVTKTPIPDGAYDDQTYLDLLGKDTIAARKYQDRFIYGDLDPVQSLRNADAIAAESRQRAVAADFHARNQDFPATPEAGTQLLATLQANHLPISLVNLEWAYGELRRTGAITPTPAVVPEDLNQYEEYVIGQVPTAPAVPAKPQRGRGAIPSAPNAGGRSDPGAVNYETMPKAEFDAMLRKNGVLRS